MSMNTRSLVSASQMVSSKSSGHGSTRESGSTLTNSEIDEGNWAAIRSLNAAAPQIQSSSPTRPAPRAAPNSRPGPDWSLGSSSESAHTGRASRDQRFRLVDFFPMFPPRFPLTHQRIPAQHGPLGADPEENGKVGKYPARRRPGDPQGHL